MGRFKRHFITGLVAILPLAFTIGILWFLIERIGGMIGIHMRSIPLLSHISRPLSSFLGFLVVLIAIYMIGLITSGVVGRWFISAMDDIMTKLPFVKGLYNAARQLVNTIFVDRSAFSKVVIIKYPWKYSYTLAFLTNDDSWEIKNKKYCNIFVPTSPNPTSGYYLLYPESGLIETKISIQDGFKIIASGGIILPDKKTFNV